MKTIFRKYGVYLSAFALFVGMVSTSATCRYYFHQPRVPERMRQLIKESK